MSFSLSTVTPVYNGSKYLETLVKRIDAVRNSIHQDYKDISLIESIFVADECIDDSIIVLRRLEKEYDWIHVVELSRNFGQHPATVAGIMHSSGDWVFTLDEDLQHPPEKILELLKACAINSHDICYALSQKSIHKSFFRDKVSKSFKNIIGALTGNKHVSDFSSFRCLRGPIARAAAATNGVDTYYDVSLSWYSQRVTTFTLDLKDIRNSEEEAKSGYSIWGLVKHAKRLVLSSKLKFLRIITLLGLFSFIFSLTYSIYVFYKIYSGNALTIKGWPSTIISIYFFGGLTCLFLGILIETISDILLKIKGKPSFFVIDRSKDTELLKQLENVSI